MFIHDDTQTSLFTANSRKEGDGILNKENHLWMVAGRPKWSCKKGV